MKDKFNLMQYMKYTRKHAKNSYQCTKHGKSKLIAETPLRFIYDHIQVQTHRELQPFIANFDGIIE